MSLGSTPSQTIGPFFSHALPWKDGQYVVPEGTAGAFWLRGRVVDGAGEPVPDALLETWQADPDGRYDADFRGFARCPTDDDGQYAILTVKPGPVPGPDGRLQAPHLAMSVFARGLLVRLVTRVYFPDEAAANEVDPVLADIPEPARATLVARHAQDGYTFDVRLQGENETVFFAV
ncbi:MAG TPA: protocatechuate 3,4-dioxygenase subunit alpha [Micromonosporaceae bacterium]|nr:protocatechuate 3,4-dioxygenase subunit alpha [Micromonosporaceae bacterium]